MLHPVIVFSYPPVLCPLKAFSSDSGNGCTLSDMLETTDSILDFESEDICIYSTKYLGVSA